MDKNRFIPIAKPQGLLSTDDAKLFSDEIKRGYQSDMIVMTGRMELYFLDLQEGKIIKVDGNDLG